MDYEKQRLLYEQHGTSQVLKKLFAQGPTAYNRQRIRKELASLAIPKQADGNDIHSATIEANQLNDMHVVESKPSDLLSNMLEQIRPLMDRRTQVHAQMSSRQLKNNERKELAFEILDISGKLNPLWQSYNYVKEHGRLPELKKAKVLQPGSADMMRRLNNLRSQRSKLKDRPERLLDYQSICAEIKAIEEALSNGN